MPATSIANSPASRPIFTGSDSSPPPRADATSWTALLRRSTVTQQTMQATAPLAEPVVAKRMNLIQLTFIVAVNMMGSGIIMLPTNMAQVGAISLLSWIVTAVGSMAIAYGFAQAGVLDARPGGMSLYAEEAHGKSGFFMVSYLYYLSLAIGNVAIAIS